MYLNSKFFILRFKDLHFFSYKYLILSFFFFQGKELKVTSILVSQIEHAQITSQLKLC